MNKKTLALLFSAFCPGLGHIYIRKYLSGILYFLVWLLVICAFLQIFPKPSLIDPTRVRYYLVWGAMLLYWGGLLYDLILLVRKEVVQTCFWPLIPIFLWLLLFIFFTLPIKWYRPNLVAGNMHTHSTCSDGRGDYETIIQEALTLKFNFLVFTDHRFQGVGIYPRESSGGWNDASCEEIARRCPQEERLLCILGQEVTGRVHILGLGLSEGVDEKQPIKEIVRQIHEQGGLAIAAHPFFKKTRFTEEELLNSGFDAMECERGSFLNNRRQYQLSREYNLPCIYTSDAHGMGMLWKTYSVCGQEIKSLEDLKLAVKGSKCERFSPIDSRVLEALGSLAGVVVNKPKN